MITTNPNPAPARSMNLDATQTAPSPVPSPPLRGRGCRRPERGSLMASMHGERPWWLSMRKTMKALALFAVLGLALGSPRVSG